MSAKLALSVPFACCWLSCFYAIVFYEQINDDDDDDDDDCDSGSFVHILIVSILSRNFSLHHVFRIFSVIADGVQSGVCRRSKST